MWTKVILYAKLRDAVIRLVGDDCALCWTKTNTHSKTLIVMVIFNANILATIEVIPIILAMRSVEWHEYHLITLNAILLPLNILHSHFDQVYIDVRIHLQLSTSITPNIIVSMLTSMHFLTTNYTVQMMLPQTLMELYLACDSKQSVRYKLCRLQTCTTCTMVVINKV